MLMICTRGQHVVSVNALPSASWAVFFLAGLMLRPAWIFAALFALASLLDFGSLAAGTIGQWCVSPAYWALLPAYASLWLAGRLQARWHAPDLAGLVRLVLVLATVVLVAYVFSGGGFYFFSGRYPAPTLVDFGARIVHYYPQKLGTLAGYVGVAVTVHSLACWIAVRHPRHQVSGA
ncbi:cobalamin ABC transporter [Rhodanobacter sp. FW510-R12]|nr:cobalamin ABC transporter [Rhodanobacter sp. FW104-R8]KZC28371.1 cobalamin ABC transporter [Rhodanobacter sp. FW510-T8]KZC32747.1 cobalamin ABC transporter [Rhodanobacter sp. FW510-R10]